MLTSFVLWNKRKSKSLTFILDFVVGVNHPTHTFIVLVWWHVPSFRVMETCSDCMRATSAQAKSTQTLSFQSKGLRAYGQSGG